MASGRAIEPEISAYLAELVRRETARGVTLSALASKAGVTHAQLSNLRSHSRGAGFKTLVGLANALGKTLAEIVSEAHDWARANPVASTDGAEPEHVRAAAFGGLPGWAEAEQQARAMFRRVPDAAWVGARALMGAQFPARGTVTPEVVLNAATLWQSMQAAVPQTAEQVESEIAEDKRLEQLAQGLKPKR